METYRYTVTGTVTVGAEELRRALSEAMLNLPGGSATPDGDDLGHAAFLLGVTGAQPGDQALKTLLQMLVMTGLADRLGLDAVSAVGVQIAIDPV